MQQPTEEGESGEESGEASGEESGEVALMGDASQQAGEDEGEGQEASGDEALSLDKLAAQELGTLAPASGRGVRSRHQVHQAHLQTRLLIVVGMR